MGELSWVLLSDLGGGGVGVWIGLGLLLMTLLLTIMMLGFKVNGFG
jgi:hypothetical protein